LYNSSHSFNNYRHSTSTHLMAQRLRDWGITEEKLIVVEGTNFDSDPRNVWPGTLYPAFDQTNANESVNIIDSRSRIDAQYVDVSEEHIMRVISGALPRYASPRQKVLRPEPDDVVIIFLTGHGGANFIKIREFDEIDGLGINTALRTLDARHGFGKLFFIGDSCQIATLQETFDVPNVYAIASSRLDEGSWSHGYSSTLGVSPSDTFTYTLGNFIEAMNRKMDVCQTSVSVSQMFEKVSKVVVKTADQTPQIDVTDGTLTALSDIKIRELAQKCIQSPPLLVQLRDTADLVAPEQSSSIPNHIKDSDGKFEIRQPPVVPGRFIATSRKHEKEYRQRLNDAAALERDAWKQIHESFEPRIFDPTRMITAPGVLFSAEPGMEGIHWDTRLDEAKKIRGIVRSIIKLGGLLFLAILLVLGYLEDESKQIFEESQVLRPNKVTR